MKIMPKSFGGNSHEDNLRVVSVLYKSAGPFLLLFAFSLLLLGLWYGFSFLNIFPINYVQKFSKDAWELLSFIGTFLQATVGISVTVTGVLVTWQLAKSTLKTAEAVVEIERQRYARESQEIARDIRHEFLISSGDFFKAYGDLAQKINSILDRAPLDIFCAHHLVRAKTYGDEIFYDNLMDGQNLDYREELTRTIKGLRLSAEHYQNLDEYPGDNHAIAEAISEKADAIEDRLASGVEIERFVDGLPYDLYNISNDWPEISNLASINYATTGSGLALQQMYLQSLTFKLLKQKGSFRSLFH